MPKSAKLFSLAIFLTIGFFALGRVEAQAPQCQDSDGGQDYYFSGKIKIEGTEIWADKCLNSIQAQEGYCDPSIAAGYRVVAFNCPKGCADGTCERNITLLSQSSREVMKEGDIFRVRWESKGFDVGEEVSVLIIRADGLQKEIAKVPLSQGNVSWEAKTDFNEWKRVEENSAQENIYEKIPNNQGGFDIAFKYKISINTIKSQISSGSDNYFTIIENPTSDLELGEKTGVDSGGVQFEVCNQGNADLDFPERQVKGKISIYLPNGDPGAETGAIIKIVPLLLAGIKKDSCEDTNSISYLDFGMDKMSEYSVRVELDPENEFNILQENDTKEYRITPKFGIKIESPNGNERWGIGSRHRIVITATGPDIWTKIAITALDQASGQEYQIDTIHVMPPTIDYWWIVPDNFIPGEQYKIKIKSLEPGNEKEDISDDYFAIIEPTVACKDSDQGKNYYEMGFVKGVFIALKDAQEERGADDFCLNENTLVEYYCKDDYVYSEHYECPYGCQNGVCKKAIKIIAPNGNEKMEPGKNHAIKWQATVPASDAKIKITLLDTRYTSILDKKEIDIVETQNNGTYDWILPPIVELTPEGSEPNYKVVIYVDDGGPGKYDESDNAFSIVKAQTALAKANIAVKAPVNKPKSVVAPKTVGSPPPPPQPEPQPQTASMVQGINNLLDQLKRLFVR